MSHSGKVALVTGGARGIGLAICEALLQKGCKVCIMDILVEEGEASVKRLNSKFGANMAMFVRGDVRSEEEFRGAFEETVQKMGRVDILANNAGIVMEPDFRKVVDVNLNGVIQGVVLGFEYMGKDKGHDGGIIINTASVLGFMTMAEAAVYTATKHGVVGLTRCYGDPYHFNRHGVAVKAVCPTAVQTELLHKTEQTAKLVDRILEKFPPVQPSYIADGFVALLEDAKNGAVMHVSQEGFRYV